MKKYAGKIMRFTLMSLFVLCLCIICTMPAHRTMAADVDKSQGELYDWTLLDDTGATPYLETGTHTYTDVFSSVLHITMVNIGAAGTANAQGFKIFVRLSGTDEGWREFIDLKMDATASDVGNMDDTAAAAQAVIPLASTTNYETPGDMFFLHDAGTIADSALVIFGGTYTNDVSITVIDNLVNAYDAADNLYNVIGQWFIKLPNGGDEAKVLFYNGDADANYACRVDYANEDDVQ